MTLKPVPPVAPADARLLIRALYRGAGDEIRDAMREIVARRDEMTPHLLETLERANANLEHPDIDYVGTLLAMYLLAQFRETRAFDPILRLLESADDQIEFIFGDTLTEDLPAILVSVADDLAPIVRLAGNDERHPYARAAAITALRVAVAAGRFSRAEALTSFGEILRQEVARGELGDTDVCESIALDARELAPREIETELRAAMEAGLVDDSVLDEDELDEALGWNPEKTLDRLRRDWHNALIDDAVAACRWWSLFHEKTDGDADDDAWLDDERFASETVKYAEPKPGRNDPCPCGSGKKYKKCCGG